MAGGNDLTAWRIGLVADGGRMTAHRLDAGPETVHWGFFDAALKPLITVESGDEVVISTVSGPPAAAAAGRIPA